MGYAKKRLAFLVSDKRLTGDGVKRTAEKKKAGRLQVYLLTLDIVTTHVPCLVHTHVHAGVYACPGLFLPSWGDIQERGRGRIGSVSEKRPQNINAWNCIGVSRCQVAKTDQGQMGTHVYGQDSTHVHTHV